nr:RDD family protein [uncultured Mucilaginibacter sp.]
MPTIKITTTQNIDIDYEVASLSQRISARIIDYVVFMCVYTAIVTMFAIYYGVEDNSPQAAEGFGSGFVVLIGVWVALCALYDLLTEVFFNGQSVGKRSVKIKVISLSGNRPSIGQYILRWLFRTIDFGITLGSAAMVSVAFSDNKQRLGDMVAGTTVVQTTPRNNFNDLVFGQPEGDYEPTYKEVMQLTDTDVVLIHDVIKNFNRTRNSYLVYKLAIRIKRFLKVAYPSHINEYQFLEIVLKDYNYLTGRGEFTA